MPADVAEQVSQLRSKLLSVLKEADGHEDQVARICHEFDRLVKEYLSPVWACDVAGHQS